MQTPYSIPDIRPVYNLLKLTYGLAPVVAGFDKFTNLLTNWENYLHPQVASMIPFTPHVFMLIVGVIEIIAGILVLLRPAVGAYVVMGWLLLIAISLIAGGHYFDVAVRDIVMSIGAYSLANISKIVSSYKMTN